MSKKVSVKEREEVIVEYLQENHGDSVSGKAIEDLAGLSTTYRANYMLNLMKKYPQIQNVTPSKKPAMYAWIEDKPFVEVDDIKAAEEFFKKRGYSNKNHEGYNDPTPAEAIDSKTASNPNPGEIWTTMESNGTSGHIFVLNALNGAAQCIKLYQKTTESQEIVGPDPFEVKIRSRLYIGDPTHVTFKPLRYCVRSEVSCHADKLKEARVRVAEVFGISVEQVINDPAILAEKIALEQTIELLKQQIEELKAKLRIQDRELPTGYVDQKSVQIAMLTQDRDTWKEVALKLLER